jgi:DNA invertase Pin-like site-specific DNA recombinase
VIKREFNPNLPLSCVAYLRMSDKRQNKRSPEQQLRTIQDTIKRCGYPWQQVGVYRDDGVSGRLIKGRAGFQRMLTDICSGRIKIDLIVVDTFERFGRAAEIADIRRRLETDFGVLIVSADTSFADPTGMVGKAMGMVEQIRATEDGRVKAHNVTRGKKDTLRLKRWAGGPRPFGYALKQMVDTSGPKPKLYNVLVPHPVEAPILGRVFELAYRTGDGSSKIAKALNDDQSISEDLKPFSWSTVNSWLQNEIYIGVGVWGANSTDIVNDARVIEPNPHPEEIERVEEFCEPLISRDVFKAVNAVREARAAQMAASMAAAAGKAASDAESGKLIKPMAGGISLNHPLSGLVKCGECGACMAPRSSGRKSKTGTSYTYYVCPRSVDHACTNKLYVHLGRLEEAAMSRLRNRLFPLSDIPGTVPPWFGGLVETVQMEMDKLHADGPRRAEELQRRISEIARRMAGWRDSLGKSDLSPLLRQDLERDYDKAGQEKIRLEAEKDAAEAIENQLRTTLNPAQVLEGLKKLGQVLGQDNATQLNIELAKHIESITCHADGRVFLKGTYLGVFEGAVDLLSNSDAAAAAPASPQQGTESSGYVKVKKRRLTHRKINPFLSDGSMAANAENALDPERFAGLAESFKWEEKFVLPQKTCWAADHAEEVLAYMEAHPDSSWDDYVAHFGKSKPTLRNAKNIALRSRESDEESQPKLSDSSENQPGNDPDAAEPTNGSPDVKDDNQAA